MITALFSILFLVVGIMGGWLACERYIQHLQFTEHDFEELFKENPHPELYDKNGQLFRGEYVVLNIPPGFDPELDGFHIEEPDEGEF